MTLLKQAQNDHDVLMAARSAEYIFVGGVEVRLSPKQIKTLYHRLLKDNVFNHQTAYQYALALIEE